MNLKTEPEDLTYRKLVFIHFSALSLALFAAFVTGCSNEQQPPLPVINSPKEQVESPNVVSDQVIIKNDDLITKPNYRKVFYLRNQVCDFHWEVIGHMQEKRWSAHLRYGAQSNCRDFESQIADHRKLLESIFKDQDHEQMSGFSLPSLSLVQPNYDWNVIIAKEAASCEDWLDYTRNYPNHKSQRSSNSILEDIIRKRNITASVEALFNPYVGETRLSNVEKVFSLKKAKLPMASRLHDIELNQNLVYDAGHYSFKVIK